MYSLFASLLTSVASYNIKIPRWNLDLYTQIFQDALTKDIRQLEFGWHGDDVCFVVSCLIP